MQVKSVQAVLSKWSCSNVNTSDKEDVYLESALHLKFALVRLQVGDAREQQLSDLYARPANPPSVSELTSNKATICLHASLKQCASNCGHAIIVELLAPLVKGRA